MFTQAACAFFIIPSQIKLHQKRSNNITKLIQNEYIQDARRKEIPNHLKVNLQTLDLAYSVNP